MSGAPALDTPAGPFTTAALLDGRLLRPDRVDGPRGGPRVARWAAGHLLVLRPLVPRLPRGMRVDACWLCAWRVRSAGAPLLVRFALGLQPGFHGGPDTGEGLAAQTWTRGPVNVSVGGPERCELVEGGLLLRAGPGDGEVEVHCALAWRADAGPDDVSTFYAVDVDPSALP